MSLREEITAYMTDHPSRPAGHPWVCTWWFKFHLTEKSTRVIRRELEAMEREKLVIADRSQSNNTQWRLAV